MSSLFLEFLRAVSSLSVRVVCIDFSICADFVISDGDDLTDGTGAAAAAVLGAAEWGGGGSGSWMMISSVENLENDRRGQYSSGLNELEVDGE